MRILSLLILLPLMIYSSQKTESPHGRDFKISCKTCHSTRGWELDKEVYSFDHNKTVFPLKGQHTVINCRQCHPTLVFSEAKSSCIDCHSDVHRGTTGLDCERCHSPASWLVSNITEIHMKSRFPLLGAHKTADCYECHKSEDLIRFDVLGINCIDCHRNAWMSATNPDHVQAGFSQDCSACHPVNSFSWTGAGFNHNFFPLVQGHSSLQCSACHKSATYADASPDCYFCHQNDYLATTNPNHTSANFPTTCKTCHSLSPGWKPANFDHSIFPLTLGHSIPTCADCHINGNYTSTPVDCYACHQSDYNSTNNPNHQATGFSTTCTECHTTKPGWKPATYTQHDTQYFPIYSGRHKGTWDLCSQCHTDQNNYALFNCIICHANAHSGKNYTNQQCYSCHPTGAGGDK